MSFNIDDSQLEQNISNMLTRFEGVFDVLAEQGAIKLQNYAKAERPWTDRTGNARLRLKCTVEKENEIRKLALAHGVDYGIFLEFARERRYAILEPVIQQHGEEVVKMFVDLLARLV